MLFLLLRSHVLDVRSQEPSACQAFPLCFDVQLLWLAAYSSTISCLIFLLSSPVFCSLDLTPLLERIATLETG